MLSDPRKKAQYDGSIGMSSSQTDVATTTAAKEPVYVTEEMWAKQMRKKALAYRDIDDFMRNTEEHKAFHAPRTALYREGWDDAVKKYGPEYNHFTEVHEEFKDQYTRYSGGMGFTHHWGSKEEDAYYSRPLLRVLWDKAVETLKNIKLY